MYNPWEVSVWESKNLEMCVFLTTVLLWRLLIFRSLKLSPIRVSLTFEGISRYDFSSNISQPQNSNNIEWGLKLYHKSLWSSNSLSQMSLKYHKSTEWLWNSQSQWFWNVLTYVRRKQDQGAADKIFIWIAHRMKSSFQHGSSPINNMSGIFKDFSQRDHDVITK